MEIKNLYDGESIKNALFMAVFIAAQNAKAGVDKKKDDLLFFGS